MAGMSTGVLIVGHGSRDLNANVEFEALVAAYRAGRPDLTVAHGYIELAQPSVITALRELAQQVERVVVLPLFLFAAGHVKNDIPLAVAQVGKEFPSTPVVVARALGVHPALVDLAYERAKPELDGARDLLKTAVIVVGRGSSDPDANADFCKVARLFAEGRELGWVLPSFIGITRPTLVETAELVARVRPERIVVVPYFLFGGRLINKISEHVTAFRARYPWIKIEQAGYLGGDERLFHLIDERLNETLTGTHPLPCDTCQYRVPVSGVTDKVGGIKALLWSLRHTFTHAQAMPHVHAHRPLTKHVLVCTNADCADRGSLQLLAELRRLIKEEGRHADIKVTRTLCMGRCGEGPTVAVYPDGIWYRGVTPADAQELVDEHLLADRLVGRLIDNIMQ
jgi:sirohydrochlorin ferrochelatase/(2Fe-2S) ferredoxin